jgi:hypothetical protein
MLVGQAWWYMSVIPAHRRLKQEDLKFEVILEYKTRPYLGTPTLKKKKRRDVDEALKCSLPIRDLVAQPV